MLRYTLTSCLAMTAFAGPSWKCTNGEKDKGEDGVDCGGNCPACPGPGPGPVPPVPPPALCAEDEYVSSGACVPCGGDDTNAAGDDPSGADTSCDAPDFDAQVLVLGGGMSGVAAAYALQQQGVSWLLLEGTGKVGGRMRNTVVDNGGEDLRLELGANWVSGDAVGGSSTTPVWDLKNKFGLTTTKQDWESYAFFDSDECAATPAQCSPMSWNDNRIRWNDFEAAFDCAYASEHNHVSAHEALKYCGWEAQTPIDHTVEMYSIDSAWAEEARAFSHLNSMGPWDYSEAAHYVHDQEAGFAGKLVDGMLADMQGPAGAPAPCTAPAYADCGRVKLNNDVRTVFWQESPVRVLMADGTEYRGNHVIVTFSIGVLQRGVNPNDPDGGNLFSPALPQDKVDALFSRRMATYTKVFMHFTEKFWGDQEVLLIPNSVRGLTGPYWQNLDVSGFRPGSRVLWTTLYAEMSARHTGVNTDDARLKAELEAELRLVYPGATVEADWILYKDWKNDPHFRGSWANHPGGSAESFRPELDDGELEYGPGQSGAAWQAFSSPIGNVELAGEVMCRRTNGYVHSAYLSGIRSANKVLGKLGKPLSDGVPGVGGVENGVTHCDATPGATTTSKAAAAGAGTRGPKVRVPSQRGSSGETLPTATGAGTDPSGTGTFTRFGTQSSQPAQPVDGPECFAPAAVSGGLSFIAGVAFTIVLVLAIHCLCPCRRARPENPNDPYGPDMFGSQTHSPVKAGAAI